MKKKSICNRHLGLGYQGTDQFCLGLCPGRPWCSYATEQHHVDWAAAEVLESTRNWYPRCMIESWHIHSEANSMNRERGQLPHICCSLLTEQKQRWRHMQSYQPYPLTITYLLFGFCHFSHSPEDDTSIGIETLGFITIEWLERERTNCYLHVVKLTKFIEKNVN